MSTHPPERDATETADRLRRTLTAVAEGTPTRDRSAELEARLDAAGARRRRHRRPRPGAARHLTVGPGAPSRERSSRRLAALAAGVVVLAGAVAVVAVAAGRDERAPHTLTPDTSELRTGWFLPADGWEITSVITEFLDVGEAGTCPCTSWVAARPGDPGASLVLEEAEAGGTGIDAEGSPIDVGGRTGTVADIAEGASFLAVSGGGRQVLLTARGVDAADLATLADAALDQRDAGGELDVDRLPLPSGFVGTAPRVTPARRAEHLVVVTAREAATGRELNYQVVPAGYLRTYLVQATALEVDDGMVGGISVEPPDNRQLVLVGGPEDLVVGGAPFGGPTDAFDDDELRRFAGDLREVSTADWRAALADAGDVDPLVLEAETLDSPPLVEP